MISNVHKQHLFDLKHVLITTQQNKMTIRCIKLSVLTVKLHTVAVKKYLL